MQCTYMDLWTGLLKRELITAALSGTLNCSLLCMVASSKLVYLGHYVPSQECTHTGLYGHGLLFWWPALNWCAWDTIHHHRSAHTLACMNTDKPFRGHILAMAYGVTSQTTTIYGGGQDLAESQGPYSVQTNPNLQRVASMAACHVHVYSSNRSIACIGKDTQCMVRVYTRVCVVCVCERERDLTALSELSHKLTC